MKKTFIYSTIILLAGCLASCEKNEGPVGAAEGTITFGACEKHRIKGVAVPGNVWKIYYKPGIVTADEWIEAGEAQTTNLIVE